MGNLQERYVNYLLHSGYTEDELIHYGVPGMKWGVRKEVYRSLNRSQRRALKGAAEGFSDVPRVRRRLQKKSARANRKIAKLTKRGKDISKYVATRDSLSKALSDLDTAESDLERHTKSSLGLTEYNRDSARASANARRAGLSAISGLASAIAQDRSVRELKKRFASENRYDEQGKLKKV